MKLSRVLVIGCGFDFGAVMRQAVKTMENMVVHATDVLHDLGYWDFVFDWGWNEARCLDMHDSEFTHREVSYLGIARGAGLRVKGSDRPVHISAILRIDDDQNRHPVRRTQSLGDCKFVSLIKEISISTCQPLRAVLDACMVSCLSLAT